MKKSGFCDTCQCRPCQCYMARFFGGVPVVIVPTPVINTQPAIRR